MKLKYSDIYDLEVNYFKGCLKDLGADDYFKMMTNIEPKKNVCNLKFIQEGFEIRIYYANDKRNRYKIFDFDNKELNIIDYDFKNCKINWDSIKKDRDYKEKPRKLLKLKIILQKINLIK